ncbi:MAG: HU family DNA-binding protein [Clostridiales bacterium]|jgi:DNA-binding protein HU-beta|nr:HU family DNA-binding protein [Clostridiales bacterium]
MNKQEIISNMAAESGLSKKDCAAALDAYIASVKKSLKEGDAVRLVGFGTFDVKKRSARTGKNPKTGESMKIPECKVPTFKAGKELKTAVNGKK